MAKSNAKKNRWTWSATLMLACGAIIIALPWLLTRSNWDPNWDKPAVAPLWKVKAAKPGYGISELAFSANGTSVWGQDDKGLRFWSASTGKQLQSLFKTLKSGATLSNDRGIAIVVRRGIVIGIRKNQLWRRADGFTSRVQIPNGKLTVHNHQLYGKRGIEVWDVSTKKLLQVIPIRDDKPNRTTDITDVVLSPDGSRLFLRLRQEYQMWDTSNRKLLWSRVNYKDFYSSPSYVFSPDNQTIYQTSPSDELKSDIISPELHLIDKRTEATVKTFPFNRDGLCCMNGHGRVSLVWFDL